MWLKGSFLPRVGPAVTQAGSLGPPGQAAHVLLVGAERIFSFTSGLECDERGNSFISEADAKGVGSGHAGQTLGIAGKCWQEPGQESISTTKNKYTPFALCDLVVSVPQSL